MTENLWPDFDLAAEPRTVRRILIEAGAGIREKTNGTIQFEVDSSPRGGGGLVHNCYLVAPGLGYRYPLMRAEHGLDQYPVTIVVSKRGRLADDEGSLMTALRGVFQDDSTKKVVLQLLDVISDSTTSSSSSSSASSGT